MSLPLAHMPGRNADNSTAAHIGSVTAPLAKEKAVSDESCSPSLRLLGVTAQLSSPRGELLTDSRLKAILPPWPHSWKDDSPRVRRARVVTFSELPIHIHTVATQQINERSVA